MNKTIQNKIDTRNAKVIQDMPEDIIGTVEMKFIRTTHQDIHAGRSTIGNCIDELLRKLDDKGDRLTQVTVYLDEERELFGSLPI
jgi:hypothetical protein